MSRCDDIKKVRRKMRTNELKNLENEAFGKYLHVIGADINKTNGQVEEAK